MTEDILRDIISRVHIALPVREFTPHFMEMIEKYRVNLEIGLDHYNLDAFPREHFAELGARLLDLGISMTVHAPFHELFLGAPDRMVRRVALDRMNHAFTLIPFFKPKTVVIHLNYEVRRFGFVYEEWKPLALAALREYAERAASVETMLMLENVYEETPEVMNEILREVAPLGVYHCCDVGHVQAFSDCSLSDWLSVNGEFVRQFHLHDNDGTGDSHFPIGTGTIDFSLVRDLVAGMETPPVITMEPHNEAHLWETLKGFHDTGLYDVMKNFDKKS